MRFKNSLGRDVSAFNRINQNGNRAARIQGQSRDGKHYTIKQTVKNKNRISEGYFR